MKFSLMMPAYNYVKYLKQAVDSVRSQTYKNWELVIQDDCSTDGTYELAWALSKQDKRIRVYRNGQNLGVPGTRANAAKHITGDLVGHIDSDDTLYPYALQTMIDCFEANPDVMLAYSDMADMDETGNVFGYRANRNPGDNLAFYGWMSFGAYRKSAYDAVKGYNRHIPSCEDGDLFMQIVDKYKFARVPVVLYARRNHGNNTSLKNQKCSTCPARTTTCNFAPIWAKHAVYDLITWTKIETEKSA
jgi:glycosyltransferase involved in cell wall biosynthesis